MTWIISAAISNAMIATLLGIFAFAVGRATRKPAVVHVLWVLVLVKLLTPPLFTVPLPVLPERVATVWNAPLGHLSHSAPTVDSRSAKPTDASLEDEPREHAQAGGVADSGASSNAKGSWTRFTGLIDHAITITTSWLLVGWAAGSVIYILSLVYVTWQMCKLMRLASPDPRIDRAMHRVAKAAKVKNYPTARVVPWVGTPMLWGLGSQSVIVLPSKLFETLDHEAADTLLQHELAHFQRGDQWVRILEAVVTTLFWWHPVVWFARTHIEASEEQCCDAWVVKQDRGKRRRYAEALLDTVDFISEAPETPLPIAASGLGRVPFLKQRLRAIMRGDEQGTLTAKGRMAALAIVAVLPLQPILLQARFVVPRFYDLDAHADQTSTDFMMEFPSGMDTVDSVEAIPNGPGPEYAQAVSPYGTYKLVAFRGYHVELRQDIKGKVVEYADRNISCVAFSPRNGASSYFAAGSRDGSVWLIDCESGEEIKEIASFPGQIFSVAISPDGKWLAVGGDEAQTQLIDIDNPANTRSCGSTDGGARSVRFSADGNRLAVVADTTWKPRSPGQVDVWDLRTMSRETTIRCPSAVGVAGFGVDGRILSAQWDGTLHTWSVTGQLIASVKRPKDSVSAAAFSPDAITMQVLATLESN